MYTISVKDDIERDVILKALETYRREQAEINSVIKFLETTPYPIGTIVSAKGVPGKVVYYDLELRLFRVTFNNDARFQAFNKEDISPYNGDIPKELEDIQPLTKLTYLGFYLEDVDTVPLAPKSC